MLAAAGPTRHTARPALPWACTAVPDGFVALRRHVPRHGRIDPGPFRREQARVVEAAMVDRPQALLRPVVVRRVLAPARGEPEPGTVVQPGGAPAVTAPRR